RSARQDVGRQAVGAHSIGGQSRFQPDAKAASFAILRIVEIVERLRVPGGTRWHRHTKRSEGIGAHNPWADAGQEILGEEWPQRLIFPRLEVASRPVVEQAITGDMLARFP